MRLYRMDAEVLQLAPAADRFLQAYTTQDAAAPRGAFIDVKGRAVAVYDHVRIDAERSVLVVARNVRDRLQQHLKTYLFLTGSELKVLPHAVYWNLDEATLKNAEWTIPRAVGAMCLSTQSIAATVGEEEFSLYRWSHRLALQGVDYDDPMLLNLNDPELVSFSKGCYLGQEIMARVHYRGKPPLRLTAVRESDCPVELRPTLTSRVRDAVTGEVRGFVFLPTS